MQEYLKLYEKHPATVIPSHNTDEVELGIAVDENDEEVQISKATLDDVPYVLPESSRSVDSYPYYVDGLKYYIGRDGDSGYDPDSKHVEKYFEMLSAIDHPHIDLWLQVLENRAETISDMFEGTIHRETVVPIVNGEPLAQPAASTEPTALQRQLQSHFQTVDAREKKSYDGEKRQCMICKERKRPGRLTQPVVSRLRWTTYNAPYTRPGPAPSQEKYPLVMCAECAQKISAGYDIAAGRTEVGDDQADLWFTRRFGGEQPMWLMIFNGEDDREQLNWIAQHVDQPRRLRKAIKGAAVGHEVELPMSPLRVKLFGSQETQMVVFINEVVEPDQLFDNVERFAARIEEGISLGQIADVPYRVKSENEDLKNGVRSDLVRSLLLGAQIPDRWIEMWHQHRLRRSRRGEAGDYWVGTNPTAAERSFCALIIDDTMTDSTAYKLGQFLASADLIYYNETDKSFYASSRHWREMVEAPEDAISNLGEKLVRQEAEGPFDHLASIDIDDVPDGLTPRQQAAMTLGFAAERKHILSGGEDSSDDQ